MNQLAERLERVRAAVLPKLHEHFGEEMIRTTEHRGELSITIPRERLISVVQFLRDEPGLSFNMLKDICAVDWNRRKERFELVYNLWSIDNSFRLRVKCFTEEKHPHVDSLCELFTSANWYERETYDMTGIIFVTSRSSYLSTSRLPDSQPVILLILRLQTDDTGLSPIPPNPLSRTKGGAGRLSTCFAKGIIVV